MRFQFNIILLLILAKKNYTFCEESFFIPFQALSEGAYSISTDQWIEFDNEIPNSREITACHWMRTKYFNVDPAFQLWSYCSVEHVGDEMGCIELYLEHSVKSANRNVVMIVSIKYKTKVKLRVELKNFHHRTWVFLCLTSSSITDETKFYYNGNLVATHVGLVNENGTILQKSSQMHEYALIFGQEPDKVRGDFDQFQAFIGDLAELNIWSYVINETEIMNMAKCKNWRKGNVVAWKKIKYNNSRCRNQRFRKCKFFVHYKA